MRASGKASTRHHRAHRFACQLPQNRPCSFCRIVVQEVMPNWQLGPIRSLRRPLQLSKLELLYFRAESRYGKDLCNLLTKIGKPAWPLLQPLQIRVDAYPPTLARDCTSKAKFPGMRTSGWKAR